jgi:hypothetical protein
MNAHNREIGLDPSLTSLVFPTYNAGLLAERTWSAVEEFLRQAPGQWEVLFVCDGCTDGSPERLAALTRPAGGRVRVLHHAANRGKGHAVRHGLAAARGAWRLFTDVDLAYGLDDVLRLAEVLWGGADVAIASRTHPDSRLLLPARLQGYAYRRHLQSTVFSALVRLLLPLTQRDTQAGLKGLSAHGASLVLPHLRCDGFGFDCELLTACVHQGLAIEEVPVCVRCEDVASTTNLRAMGRMVFDLWKTRRYWQRQPPAEPREPAGRPNREAA